MLRCVARVNTLGMSLRDYIAERRTALKAQMQALRAELRELDIAESALAGGAEQPLSGGSAQPTIKEMIVAALRKGPSDAHEIIAEIKKLFGNDVPRSSLSPQLSRLKSERVVDIVDNKWTLVMKNPEPNGPGSEKTDPFL